MRRFKAFTLTELMIALAVLGILIAVVTPAIMKARPNKNKMMVKKTFYTTEKIIGNLINDEVLYPDKRDSCTPVYDADNCKWGFDDESSVTFEGASYTGNTKFGNLFMEMLNVKQIDDADEIKFYTNDGAYWDLSGTMGAWETDEKVGKFTDASPDSGMGTIKIVVDGEKDRQTECTEHVADCNTYEVQLLANGKLRINPEHKKAIQWTEINTTVKD